MSDLCQPTAVLSIAYCNGYPTFIPFVRKTINKLNKCEDYFYFIFTANRPETTIIGTNRSPLWSLLCPDAMQHSDTHINLDLTIKKPLWATGLLKKYLAIFPLVLFLVKRDSFLFVYLELSSSLHWGVMPIYISVTAVVYIETQCA